MVRSRAASSFLEAKRETEGPFQKWRDGSNRALWTREPYVHLEQALVGRAGRNKVPCVQRNLRRPNNLRASQVKTPLIPPRGQREGLSSMVERMLAMLKVLGSIPGGISSRFNMDSHVKDHAWEIQELH